MIEPLTPAELRRLRELFDEASDLGSGDRETLLRDLATREPRLARELEALLLAHESTGSHLVSPISSGVVRSLLEGDDPWIGKRIGPYLVEERLGAGGMGVVYRALRDDQQFSKRVAIKFLRRSAESDLALRRFRYERQILANLSHRNIAALLDGGTTDDGQPWLVMELVEGEPITTWCREHRSTIQERLGLFRQVCGAVQHAHQHLVVHRDLKPGNIHVTADGTVKLLDFGIAKLLRAEEGSDQLPPTQGGGRVFTPDYAAPEQVRGLPVGTSADVYALGVLLFELLAGRRPFELDGKLLAEIEEAVCRTPPPRPSAVITEGHAATCGTRAAALRRRLRGDLDAIVLTALRKEPERRFGSADRLARDIALHLRGHPVTARPDGLRYRADKFVRRRKVELVAGTLVVGSLLGGTWAVRQQAIEAADERDRATEVTEFLGSMLSAVDPSQLGREVTMREVLDSAAVRAGTLTARPLLEMEVRHVIAATYLALGDFERAMAEYHLALTAAERAEPRGGRRLAFAMSQLATGYEYNGEYGAADSIFTEAQRMMERFGFANQGEEREWLEHRGRILARLGNFAEAIPLMRRALDLHLVVEPENDSATAYYYHNLALVTGEVGDNVGADSLFRTALRLEREALGEEHPMYASSLSSHSTVLERMGNMAATDTALREVLRIRRQVLGEEHPDYAWSMFNYADFLVQEARYREAAEWSRKVLALRGKTLDDPHPAVSTAIQVLGRALAGMDSLEQAEALLRESLALRREHFPPGHWIIASSVSHLGAIVTLTGRFEEAESLLVAGERELLALRGPQAQPVKDARQRLVDLYMAWGKPEEAAKWRESSPES